MGAKAQRLLYQLNGFLRPARKEQNARQGRMALSKVRVEGDGSLGLSQGSVMLLFAQINTAQELVRLWERIIEGHGLLRQDQRLLQSVRVRAPLRIPLQVVGPPQPRVGVGILWVQLNGALTRLSGLDNRLWRKAVQIRQPTQQGV